MNMKKCLTTCFLCVGVVLTSSDVLHDIIWITGVGGVCLGIFSSIVYNK